MGVASLTAYIVRRILFIFPILAGILFVTFLLQAFIPTDAVSMMYQGQATEEQASEAMTRMRARFNLDQPWYIQFLTYSASILRGDLGISIRTRQPVAKELGYRYLNTLKLTAASLVIALVVGVGSGIVSAYYKDTVLDVAGQAIGLFGLSMPAFFFGIVLIMIFAVQLRLVPVIGMGDWRHLILPALCLGLIESASLSRITRSAMLDVMNQDYIRTSRAKGLRERLVIGRHALKNTLLPVITVLGLKVGGLLGGAFIIEVVFAWHGIGELAVKAIQWRDFTITQGIIVIGAATYVVVNLIVDIGYVFVDPRIRYD
jgi:ABC-type dipeptide/oligopeptide/nickel transport system permease component